MVGSVKPLNLILVWPVRLQTADTTQSLRDRARTTLIKSGWSIVTDLVRRNAAPIDDGAAYAEFAYFHPYVQRFLYGDRESPIPQPFELLEFSRKNASTLNIQHSTWAEALTIEQTCVYLIESDIAILSIRLSSTASVDGERVLDIISFLRTVYFPFYDTHGAVWSGGNALNRVRIEPLQATAPEDPADRSSELKDALHQLRPILFAHWVELIRPLNDAGIEVRLLGDHRMATMAFLGVEYPVQISDDEWFALAQADDARFTKYAPAFRDRELAAATYDRWWNKRAKLGELKHRYLAGPMTYCCVLEWPAENRPRYCERILKTWTRQHFQIFFLAHFQRAKLLLLQDRIAKVTARIALESERDWLREVEALQREMAIFSSCYWFTEVSPQVQGQELYLLLKQQMGLDALYEGVIHDKALLGNWIEAREGRRREHWRDRINDVFLPLGLLLAFLGSNVIVDPVQRFIKYHFGLQYDGRRDLLVVMLFALPVLLWWAWNGWRRRRIERSGTRFP